MLGVVLQVVYYASHLKLTYLPYKYALMLVYITFHKNIEYYACIFHMVVFETVLSCVLCITQPMKNSHVW